MRIRTTIWPDLFGDGREKEIVDEKSGKTYRVRTTIWPDLFGEGRQKEIVEVDDGPLTPEDEHRARLIMGYGGAFLMGLVILFLSESHLFEWSWWLAVGLTAFIPIRTILKDVGRFINLVIYAGVLVGFLGSCIALIVYCTM